MKALARSLAGVSLTSMLYMLVAGSLEALAQVMIPGGMISLAGFLGGGFAALVACWFVKD